MLLCTERQGQRVLALAYTRIGAMVSTCRFGELGCTKWCFLFVGDSWPHLSLYCPGLSWRREQANWQHQWLIIWAGCYIYILYTYRWLDAILSMIGYEVYISIGLLHAGCTSHGCQCAETSTCSDSCVAPFHCKQLQLTLRIWATSLEKKWKAIWPSRVSSPSSETWPKHRSEELSS